MNWFTVLENIISGVATAAICGTIAWFIYSAGIKGKDKSQIASERKRTIFIPLKNELQSIYQGPENIWRNIKLSLINQIISNEDEFIVDDEILRPCNQLICLVNEYNRINLYDIAADILFSQFKKAYIDLFGSSTHPSQVFDDALQDYIDINEDDLEIERFRSSSVRKDIINCIINNREYDEIEIAIGHSSPVNDYLITIISSALLSPESTYIYNIVNDVAKKEIKDENLSLPQYMVKGFNFFEVFDCNPYTVKKEELLVEIRELAFSISETVSAKIRMIGRKYEKE